MTAERREHDRGAPVAPSGVPGPAPADGVIALLAPDVIERIAAGEVIERPASAVKELLENAFDAGAGSITLEVEAGGAALIRVSDDGAGIRVADAPALFQRHATSKLRSDADLGRLATFGFRGEALASIGAVSDVEIVSRHAADGTGFRLRIVGGARESFEPAPRTTGTTITVRRLFFNTPARERFMHGAREEAMEVARVVTRYAAARPGLAIRYLKDGGPALTLAADRDHESRWRLLYGADVVFHLVPLDWIEHGVRVGGAVSDPDHSRGNASEIQLFVNGRLVADRGITGALLAGYHGLLPARRYPRAIVMLELAPELVDVNVHPAKREVRFARRDVVQDAVRHAASRALVARLDPRGAMDRGGGAAGARAPLAAATGAPLAPLREHPAHGYADDWFGKGSEGAVSPPGAALSPDPSGAPPGATSARGEDAASSGLPAQIDRTFILFADADGLRLYDQHTAHERILFEDALRRIEVRRGEAQELLIPTVLTLTPEEEAGLALIGDALAALGYSISPFGERTVLVSAHPSSLRRWDGGAALRRMLATGAADGASGARAVAATYACRHAIMAGETLTRGEMLALVTSLRRAAEPELCPHGRPTTLTITARELRHRFRRE